MEMALREKYICIKKIVEKIEKSEKKYDTIWHRTISQRFYMIIAYFSGGRTNIRKTNQNERWIP